MMSVLASCQSNNSRGSMPVYMLWPRYIKVTIAEKNAPEYKARQAGKKEFIKLIKKNDLNASARCIAGECLWTHEWGNTPNRDKLMLQSSRTILQNWSENPLNSDQVIAVMLAYALIAKYEPDQEKAKVLRIKGLGFLQHDSINRLHQSVKYSSTMGKNFLESIDIAALHLLSPLRSTDLEKMTCSYPEEVKSSFYTQNKFSETEIMRLLKLSCWNSSRNVEYENFEIIWD